MKHCDWFLKFLNTVLECSNLLQVAFFKTGGGIFTQKKQKTLRNEQKQKICMKNI